MKETQVLNVPVISTGHLSSEVADILSNQGDKNPWCPCAEWEYGFFVWVGSLETDHVPQCLSDLSDWLHLNGFTDGWVRLDRDADPVDGLPYYDW